MSEIERSKPSNLPAKSSKSLAGIELLSERIMAIQNDSLKSTQLGFAKIFESYHIPDAVRTMTNLTENLKLAIPKIDMPIDTIAAMRDLQKTAFAALQASIPDLSQIASTMGTSMLRFQIVSSFLKCC